MDSGMAKESFNIISQGKIEDILSNKPENRRVIFEEAAGVLKYKNSNYKVKISDIVKNDDNYLLELELNGLYKELKEGTNIKVSLDLD